MKILSNKEWVRLCKTHQEDLRLLRIKRDEARKVAEEYRDNIVEDWPSMKVVFPWEDSGAIRDLRATMDCTCTNDKPYIKSKKEG